MSLASLTFRAYARYFVPLVIVSAIALSPLVLLALRMHAAPDPVVAKAQLKAGWVALGCAWMLQLWLVAGVAPLVRATAANAPLSQARALLAGLRGLAIGLVPCAAAVIAIAIGTVALVVPGLILLVLLVPTGAGPRLSEPLPSPFVDAAEAARSRLVVTILLVVSLFALAAAIGGIAHLAVVPKLQKPVTTDAMLAARKFVRAIVVALVALSPLPACAIAAVAATRRKP